MFFGSVTMFNKPESEAILNKKYPTEKIHWKKVLNYCLDGNFQAMLDEYAHLLATSGFSFEEASRRFTDVLSTPPSQISCQFEEDKNDHNVKMKESSLRCHYAVPLGTQKTSTDEGNRRISNVRDAFNSPFRPFVLN